jgi:hypothetical protein
MKQLIFATLTLFLLTLSAQPGTGPGTGQKFAKSGEGKEKIEAMRVEFITHQLSLTEEEGKKFWPVFNMFEEERKAIRRADNPQGLDVLSDPEVGKYIQDFLNNKQKEADIYKKYVPEFRKVINERKVAKLLTIEGEFKRMLLQKAGTGAPNAPGWKGAPAKPGN